MDMLHKEQPEGVRYNDDLTAVRLSQPYTGGVEDVEAERRKLDDDPLVRSSMNIGAILEGHAPDVIAERPSGLRVNYYLCRVENPQRENQVPYTAECEDLIDALGLTPDEANIFKEIWRSANARTHGNGKIGHSAIYGAEKIVHYAGRILRRLTWQQRK